MKKKTTILFLCLGICLLAAAALGCFLLMRPHGQAVLHYNLDGAIYQNPNNTALSNRKPNESGVYQIDFAAEGKTVTYTTTDPKLVDRIDCLQVMTLEVNGSGEIQKVGLPDAPIAKEDMVQQIFEDRLILNTSIAYNGGQLELPLAEGCRFYDLSEGGADTQPELMDEVLVYGNARGEATDVFIVRRVPYTKLYWRLNRYYDAKADATTRQADDSGIFTVPFLCEGERVEFQCKDWAVMADIEAPESTDAAMGLVLDDEGFIIQMLPGYRALRGRQLCNMYDVTALEADRFTVVNKQVSSVYGRACSVTLGEDCKIYDISSGAEINGQLTDALQLGDRVTVFSDPMGIATNIFVQVRLLDSPVYYNMYRMYQSGSTIRLPDPEGWYSFTMVCDGEVLTLKTKDKAIANKVDSYSSCAMGMIRDGDVIQRVFDSACVTGGGALVTGRYVFSYTAAMIAAGNARGGGLKAVMLHKDCKIYDVTGNPGTTPGQETTLREGDRFNAIGDTNGQATHIFITGRAI